jgi:hypothetical protein
MAKNDGGNKEDANKESKHPLINSTQPSIDEVKISFNQE